MAKKTTEKPMGVGGKTKPPAQGGSKKPASGGKKGGGY